MQYTGEKPVKEITLRVYYGSADSQCYLDEGEGYGYEKQQYKLCRFKTIAEEENSIITINQKQKGKYEPDCKTYRLLLHGLPQTVEKVLVDGKEWPIIEEEGVFILKKVPFGFKNIELSPS